MIEFLGSVILLPFAILATVVTVSLVYGIGSACVDKFADKL